MTVGEVIALLIKYCSDVDSLLMCRSMYSIDVHDQDITVYTIGSDSDVIIKREEHEID